MPGEHRFKDEWIVRIVSGVPGVGPEKIAELRAQARPSLAADLVGDGTLAWPWLGEALKAAHGFGWLGDEPVEADKLAVSLVPEKVCRRQGLGLVDLPILILTASSDDKSQEQALSLGADDFVTKPFKPSIVTARLKAILRRRAAAGAR